MVTDFCGLQRPIGPISIAPHVINEFDANFGSVQQFMHFSIYYTWLRWPLSSSVYLYGIALGLYEPWVAPLPHTFSCQVRVFVFSQCLLVHQRLRTARFVGFSHILGRADHSPQVV